MHRVLRWAAVAVVATLLGGASPTLADVEPPCGATPAVASSYAYQPGEPVVLIGAGDATAALAVDRLPTDRYGTVTVASDSDGPFVLTLTPPRGAVRTIFSTTGPDSLTAALLLDQTGAYALTVVAPGSWAIVIR